MHYDLFQISNISIRDNTSGKVLDTYDKIRVIEESFSNVNRTPVHPSNPSLTVVGVMDVVPDIDFWENELVELLIKYI
jgi:hypothetical protein